MMGKFIQTIARKFGDFFLDKQDNGDEKRLWGNVLIACGIVVVFTNAPGTDSWITAGGLIVLGLGALTVAGAQDNIQGGPKL